MKHKPVPIGVVLTGVIYFGLLFYWQWDELQGEGAARDAAIFGIVLAVAHVAYVMACFQRDLPASMKVRALLAQALFGDPQVLLLDEPTNDLDVETLRALEEALLAFPGTVLVISHDRWFLDRIATHILAYEGDSQATFFEGNYTEYEEDRKKRLGGEIIPTRVKYRRLAD